MSQEKLRTNSSVYKQNLPQKNLHPLAVLVRLSFPVESPTAFSRVRSRRPGGPAALLSSFRLKEEEKTHPIEQVLLSEETIQWAI